LAQYTELVEEVRVGPDGGDGVDDRPPQPVVTGGEVEVLIGARVAGLPQRKAEPAKRVPVIRVRPDGGPEVRRGPPRLGATQRELSPHEVEPRVALGAGPRQRFSGFDLAPIEGEPGADPKGIRVGRRKGTEYLLGLLGLAGQPEAGGQGQPRPAV